MYKKHLKIIKGKGAKTDTPFALERESPPGRPDPIYLRFMAKVKDLIKLLHFWCPAQRMSTCSDNSRNISKIFKLHFHRNVHNIEIQRVFCFLFLSSFIKQDPGPIGYCLFHDYNCTT